MHGLIGDKFVTRKQKCLGKRKMKYTATPCLIAKETAMTGKLLLYLFCDLLEAIKL